MLATAAAAVALMLVGFWGGGASAGQTASASAAKSVDIKNFAFRPGTLTVGAGTKVVFTNSSGVSHTATRAGDFNTGRIKPGKSATVHFGQKGTFAYHCTIHSFMRGKVVVN